jgi:diacylglycerol kinase family enzyme
MFAATAILLTISALHRGRVRTLLCWVWALAGLALGLDRIFLGVHYLSDVVAGWLLGAAIALLAWQLVVRMGAMAPAVVPGADGAGPSRFAVIANPVHIPDMAAFRASVTAAGAEYGWAEPLWFETRVDDPGVGMSERALAAEVRMVLAAGGDGTVRIVCSKLAGTGVAVGVVPLGTGNLLARNLGLPLHPADALETALAGRDRAVDVVRVRGDDMADTCFTVMGGLGLDAAIMAGAPDQLKARMGWPAYVVSALRQLQHPATWVEVSVDDRPPVRRKVRTVVIGNVGSLQAGIPLLPDALIDDGRLDVVVIAPRHTVGWLRLVVRVLRRTRRTDEHLDRMTGQRVSIRAEKPLLRQLDGDPVGEGRELHAEVLPSTLVVRVLP